MSATATPPAPSAPPSAGPSPSAEVNESEARPDVKKPRRKRKKNADENGASGAESIGPEAPLPGEDSPIAGRAEEDLGGQGAGAERQGAGAEALPPRQATRPEINDFVRQLSDTSLAWLLQEAARECRQRLLPQDESWTAESDEAEASPSEPHPLLLRTARTVVADLAGED